MFKFKEKLSNHPEEGSVGPREVIEEESKEVLELFKEINRERYLDATSELLDNPELTESIGKEKKEQLEDFTKKEGTLMQKLSKKAKHIAFAMGLITLLTTAEASFGKGVSESQDHTKTEQVEDSERNEKQEDIVEKNLNEEGGLDIIKHYEKYKNIPGVDDAIRERVDGLFLLEFYHEIKKNIPNIDIDKVLVERLKRGSVKYGDSNLMRWHRWLEDKIPEAEELIKNTKSLDALIWAYGTLCLSLTPSSSALRQRDNIRDIPGIDDVIKERIEKEGGHADFDLEHAFNSYGFIETVPGVGKLIKEKIEVDIQENNGVKTKKIIDELYHWLCVNNYTLEELDGLVYPRVARTVSEYYKEYTPDIKNCLSEDFIKSLDPEAQKKAIEYNKMIIKEREKMTKLYEKTKTFHSNWGSVKEDLSEFKKLVIEKGDIGFGLHNFDKLSKEEQEVIRDRLPEELEFMSYNNIMDNFDLILSLSSDKEVVTKVFKEKMKDFNINSDWAYLENESIINMISQDQELKNLIREKIEKETSIQEIIKNYPRFNEICKSIGLNVDKIIQEQAISSAPEILIENYDMLKNIPGINEAIKQQIENCDIWYLIHYYNKIRDIDGILPLLRKSIKKGDIKKSIHHEWTPNDKLLYEIMH